MFLIINYDIEKKRCSKVMRFLRPYLHHIQESVFVGEITESTLKAIEKGLSAIIDHTYDRVVFYRIHSLKTMRVSVLGVQNWIENIL